VNKHCTTQKAAATMKLFSFVWVLFFILPNCAVSEEEEFVDVVISFEFDDFPFETGWSLSRVSNGETLVSLPVGSYSLAAKTDDRTFSLLSEEEYKVVVEDLAGDGMCCNTPGTVTVTQYGTVLGIGGGPFEFAQTISFTTDQELTAPPSPPAAPQPTPGPTNFRPSTPTIAPRPRVTLNPAFKPTDFPSQFPTCTPIPVTCTLFIKFDDFPEELGWSIKRVDTGEVIASRSIGHYGFDSVAATEEIELLSEGIEYILEVEDEWNDGFGDGYLTLAQEGRVTLAYGGSDFDVSNGLYPFQTVAECTFTEPSIQTMVALTIDFGFSSDKVGWLLTDQSNVFSIKASKPVGFFKDSVPPPPVQIAQAASDETSRTTFWLELGASYIFSISIQNVNINDNLGERVTGTYKLTSVFNEGQDADNTIMTGSYEFDGYGDMSQSITFTVPNDQV
jgi:hypothetical protein